MQFRAFLEAKAEAGQPHITLACGHNSYSEDVQFVSSAIELLEGVQDGTLEPAEVRCAERNLVYYIVCNHKLQQAAMLGIVALLTTEAYVSFPFLSLVSC